MIVWYLSIAVLLQTGQPDFTYRYPFPTKAACEIARVHADASLAAEALEADPTNSAKAITHCDPEDFGTLPKTKHVPGKDET
jgi:hypothetical protein